MNYHKRKPTSLHKMTVGNLNFSQPFKIKATHLLVLLISYGVPQTRHFKSDVSWSLKLSTSHLLKLHTATHTVTRKRGKNNLFSTQLFRSLTVKLPFVMNRSKITSTATWLNERFLFILIITHPTNEKSFIFFSGRLWCAGTCNWINLARKESSWI